MPLSRRRCGAGRAIGYRFGDFKPSPDTEAAIRQVVIAGGVTPPATVEAKMQEIY